MPDIEGIFEDSLLALFNHRPIAFSTPGPDEPYAYAPSPIRYLDGTPVHLPRSKTYAQEGPHVDVDLPVAPPGLHTTLQLTHIWLSSILLSDLVTHGCISVHGARICELGAGAGLPGIVAACSGARAVVSTDYAVPSSVSEQDEDGRRRRRRRRANATDVLGILRGNFHRALARHAQQGGGDDDDDDNDDDDEDDDDDGDDAWHVLGHTWGEPVRDLLTSCTPAHVPEKFHTILCADLLWTTSAHAALITSLTALLAPQGGIVHMVAGLHQGRGAVDRFRRAWVERTAGWIEDVFEVQWGRDGWEVLRDWREGREARKGDCAEAEDEHGTVVYFRIGLRDDPSIR
ncbi:hypothetical protein NliqN6_2167 [Naganishia liquefaciens]|uniref:Nicotinamide N-methyltransferase n=1 Tax=Naganishia liquefaciens TaxID=104408 RepID=A0A8H3YDS2_9TREE|nr:hypothetical protein NliqN6_2167 [Naganishia liquefaciens]